MNDRYFRELRKRLRCTRKVKKRLLEHFWEYHCGLSDEKTDYNQMTAMFGPPEEMARTLMEEVTAAEHLRYRRSIWITKITAVILAVLFMGSSIYILFIKEMTVIEYKEGLNIGESSETPSIMEGYS